MMTREEYRRDYYDDRAAKRRRACQCGDLPGYCPGPENCPMVADEEDGDEH